MRSCKVIRISFSKWFLLLLLNNQVFFTSAQPLSGILPKYDAYVNQPDVTFQWNAMQSAQFYSLVLASDSLFSVNVFQYPPQTALTLTVNSLDFGKWYWKVIANNGQQNIESAINRFIRFDPSQASVLSLWVRSDAGLVLDANGRVESWLDQSQNGHVLTQATLSKRPFVIQNYYNGLPSINFQGGQVLSGGDILDLGTSSRRMFVVGRFGGNDQTFFAKANGVQALSRYALMRFGSQSTVIYQEISDNHLFSPTSSTALSLWRFDNNRVNNINQLFLNSSTIGIKAINPTHNMQSSFRFLVGGFNGSNDVGELFYLNGHISEMVFVNTDNPLQIDQVQQYLKHKYHPPLNLGADISPTGFCNTSISATSGFSNLLWNTGSTSNSISTNQDGTFWVSGTDPFGFLWQDTILVTYPTIPSPVNTGICAGQANTWNADMGAGFTYLWSNGQTTPALNITTPGDYFVKVTDQFGCFKYSDTLTFTLDNYSLTANLGPDTNLCSGNLIALQSGAGETVSYIWPDGTTGNQYAVDTTGSYFVEAVNVNGCVARDTVHINVIGVAPLAEFTTANVCDGVNAVFTDNSVPVGTAPIDGWAWDFGDTTSATTQSPTHTYAAPGTYIVELFVSQGGCGAFHYDTVTVYQNPQALFTFSGHCQGQPVQFNNASTIGNAPLITYSWDFDMPWTGAYNTSTIPIPYREFDSIGVFDVQFTVTDANGCADSVTIPVLIDPSPEVVFTMPDGCVNQSISAQFTGLTQNPSTYLWDFGDNAFSILNNPSHNFSVYGEYTVSLSVTNAFNCTVVGQDQIDVFAVPVPSFDLGPYCKGTYVEMTNTSTIAQDSVTQTTWVINTTDTISGNPGFYLIPELGQQQIEVITTSNEGCSSSTFEFIEVEDSLNVSFSAGTGIAAVGEPFLFTNTTTGTNLALWNFGDQTFSSEFSPDHTYGEALTDSTLQVYLIGLNASGCIDTAFQNVIVRPSELDLALETLFLQENGTFDFLGVKMNNAGTVRVKKVVFEVLSDKGPLVQETWTGNLLPTEDTIYVFQSQPSLQFSPEDEKEAFVCVKSIAYDWQNQAETLLQNNDRCLNLEGDGVILTTLAPNPASNEVRFQLLVTKSSVISAELIDMNGKRARLLIPSTTVEPGIVEFKADVRTIENGVYFLQFNCNGTTTTQRLVILQ